MLCRRALDEANRDRPQPRRNFVAPTSGVQAAELGAIFRAAYFVERTLSRHSPLGKNEKDSLARNREANLSAKTRKRMAPTRDPGAKDCLRGIVEENA